jgi:hypothetical protein
MGIIDNPLPKNLKHNSRRMPRIQPKKNVLSITNLKLQNSFSNIPQFKDLPSTLRTILRNIQTTKALPF